MTHPAIEALRGALSGLENASAYCMVSVDRLTAQEILDHVDALTAALADAERRADSHVADDENGAGGDTGAPARPAWDPALSLHRYGAVMRLLPDDWRPLPELAEHEGWTWTLKTLANDSRILAGFGLLERRVRPEGRHRRVDLRANPEASRVTTAARAGDDAPLLEVLRGEVSL